MCFEAIDAEGERMTLRMPVECDGVPDLQNQHSHFGVDVIGILGRLLQFCRLAIDGEAGTVSIVIGMNILGRERRDHANPVFM